MAFTPINSSDATSDDSIGTTVRAESVAPDYDAAATVASAYLGRGELTKKPASKGKKRAANASAPSETKRRQTSNINDGLKISKTAFEDDNEAINYEILTPPTLEASSSKSSKRQTTTSQPVLTGKAMSVVTDELASTAAKPISVFSSTTTMTALGSTSLPTSVECAKASEGQGFTLYQGPSSTASFSSSVAITKPFMPNKQPFERSTEQRVAQHCGEATTCNRRSARLEKGAGVPIDTPQHAEFSHSLVSPVVIDDFEEDLDDVDMAGLEASNDSETEFRPKTPPARSRKLNLREVDELEDYGGAFLSEADRQALVKVRSNSDDTPKPIVRKPFPPAILDRSPIFGASQGVVLRTCFRVGEALVTGCHAARNGNDVVIELYASVTASWREPAPGRKQHFMLKDIYHDNPPYLEGTFELWQQSQLWDLDSKVFLGASKGAGIMCRVIARMRRDGQKRRLEMLSVWEATWEDVNFAAGICGRAVGK